MPDWKELRGARIFITGGTGFLGAALLEQFLEANRLHRLQARAVVLSRNPDSFRAREPRLAADAALEFHPGDVGSFTDPQGSFTHIVHGAADPGAPTAPEAASAICAGTERVLDLAGRVGVRRLLFLSSGAVYGAQPDSVPMLSESCSLQPRSPYGEAKRAAELLCLRHGANVAIARCFAFLGPRMPLDGSFAAGNFFRDALAGRDIHVQGDGADVRSYLYVCDCARWLWAILLHGASGEAYNVGSDVAVTIAGLARKIAAHAPGPPPVRIHGRNVPGVSRRYVPSIEKARALELDVSTPLDEAIRLTWQWYSRGAGAARGQPAETPGTDTRT